MEVVKDLQSVIRDKIAEELITPDKCPFCGETEDHWINPGGFWRIGNEIKYKRGRFFQNGKFYTKGFYVYIDRYKCYTCGAEWKTDPYRVDGY